MKLVDDIIRDEARWDYNKEGERGRGKEGEKARNSNYYITSICFKIG